MYARKPSPEISYCKDTKTQFKVTLIDLNVSDVRSNLVARTSTKEHCTKCVMNCKFCETNFENQKGMSVHIQTHHSDKKFECLKCGKKYSEKRDLKKHQQKCTQTLSILYYFYTVTTIMKRNPNRDVQKCILNIIFFTIQKIKLHIFNDGVSMRCMLENLLQKFPIAKTQRHSSK